MLLLTSLRESCTCFAAFCTFLSNNSSPFMKHHSVLISNTHKGSLQSPFPWQWSGKGSQWRSAGSHLLKGPSTPHSGTAWVPQHDPAPSQTVHNRSPRRQAAAGVMHRDQSPLKQPAFIEDLRHYLLSLLSLK